MIEPGPLFAEPVQLSGGKRAFPSDHLALTAPIFHASGVGKAHAADTVLLLLVPVERVAGVGDEHRVVHRSAHFSSGVARRAVRNPTSMPSLLRSLSVTVGPR